VVPAGIVGGLPWLLYAARHGRSAFYQTEVASSYPERLKNFFVDMVPRAFGGKVPFSLDWLGGTAGHVAFLLLLVVALVAVGVRLRDVDARRRLEPLIVTAAAYPFLATVPRVSSFTDEPRYVLMLAPVVVLLLSSTITTTAARAMVGLGAIALGAVFVVASLAWSDDHRPDDGLAPPGLGSIERLLERRGIDHVYGDYWIAYRLMFDTDERVTASPVLSVRNDEFAAEVAAGRETPYVVYAGDVYDREFGPALHEAGISFERLVTGDYALYLPDRPVEPDRFEDIWLQSP
jgi:hypothetical protein